jgi:hypothetical protein
MSKQYVNNMRGVLFKNTNKRDGKKDADYRGQCEIDRKPFWIDAWINESQKDGSKFMSLRFNPKLAKDRGAVPHKEAEPGDPGGDVPF